MFKKLKNLWTFSSRDSVTPDSAVLGTLTESGAVADLPDDELLQKWKSLQLDGRRIEIFHPGHPTPPTAAVLFLHGHAAVMLNKNTVFTRLFYQHNLLAVCPVAGPCWWLNTVCPAFDPEISPQRWLLNSVVPMVEREFSIACPRIALLGVSMGGQGALQLSYAQAGRFPAVAAIAPAVDFYQLYGQGTPLDEMFPDAESARQASVVLQLHPLAWPRHQFFCCDPADADWYEGCARLAMKLSSSGILHERDLETSAGGHSWEYFNHMAPRAIRHLVDGMGSVG